MLTAAAPSYSKFESIQLQRDESSAKFNKRSTSSVQKCCRRIL